MANRWGNNGNRERLYFCGLQNHWRWLFSHGIKRHLLLGRKVMTNLDSILKSRAITLTMKVQLVKAMVFPVVLYGYENWTINKAEHWRPDTFNCGVGEDSLESWRSNQSILKEISPEYLLEGLMLKLKLQYFGHLMQRPDSWKRPWCWERLKVGGEGDRHHRLNRHEFE